MSSSYARIIHFATSVLCSARGSMSLVLLHHRVFQRFDITEDEFFSYIVKKCPRFLVLKTREEEEEEAGTMGSGTMGTTIVAKTSLRLCRSYSKQDCGTDCQDLHLCKYFVYGNCRYGKGRKPCKFSHDVRSDHNYPLLRECTLHELSEDDLFLLLLQNDPSMLPEVCSHYNRGTGPYGACTFQDNCAKVHLCMHYVQGDCLFGHKCKRQHIIDHLGRRTLEDRGLSGDIIHDLPNIYQNVYHLTAAENMSDPLLSRISSQSDEKNEICLHFIRKNCRFQDKCVRVHFHLPYKWEISEGDGWRELKGMEEIERTFCDPRNTHSAGARPVDFLAMTREAVPVRRLSTASSITKPAHYILTTEWLWFYKGDHENWVEYGRPDDKQRLMSATSRDLEESYLADNSAEITVTKGHREYYLSYQDMYQRNLKHNTKRKVRRRPKFVSVREVEKLKLVFSPKVLSS